MAQDQEFYNDQTENINEPPSEKSVRIFRRDHLERIEAGPNDRFVAKHSDGFLEWVGAGGSGAGAQGAQGFQGTPGGGAGSGAYAEFVQHIQGSNASIAPGSAVSYTGDQAAVYDTIGITTAAGPAGQGTAFQLPAGVYFVDWENSADAAWSLAIYQGISNTVLAIDTNTIAGASTATTWIHGRSIITSAPGDDWIIVSPVVGTAGIRTARTAAGEFIARITFFKLA